MSHVLTYLGGIGDTGEKYSLVTAPVGEEKALTVGDHHLAIYKSDSPVLTQDLGKVFQVVSQSLTENPDSEVANSETLIAWERTKTKFEKADLKYRKKYNFIVRILIKLWHWITRNPTLEQSYQNLSKNLIKASPWWKHFHDRETAESKAEYLKKEIFRDGDGDLFMHEEYYTQMISMLAKEESPELIFEAVLAYLDESQACETHQYLVESGMLHEPLAEKNKVGSLLSLIKTSLKEMSEENRKKFLSNKWTCFTLLAYSIDCRDQQLIRYIQRRQEKLFDSDTLGRFLYRSVRIDDMSMVRLFLLKNTELHIQDQDGNSPLHLAIESGNLNMVKLLIGKGAKTDLKNKEGKTPGECASTPEMIAYFHKLEA